MTKVFLPSPIGIITIICDGDRLCSIRIDEGGPLPSPGDGTRAPASSVAAAAAEQLDAYFRGELDLFDLPLAPSSSPRGEALRTAIIGVPAGATLSYGALARATGSSPRAIGQACARNPFPVVVPCHRVIASGGGIGHYSAGRGITTKRWLLDHERRGGLI